MAASMAQSSDGQEKPAGGIIQDAGESARGTAARSPQKVEDSSPPLVIAHNTAVSAAVGSCVGEIITTLLTYPMELVKSRLQAGVQDKTGASGYAYRGLAHGLLCVVRDEGVLGLFTGLNSVVIRTMTAEVATMYFGEFLVAWWRARKGSGLMTIPLRTMGGWASVSMTLPFETIATRVTCTQPPLSIASATRQLWQEGGPAALWSGLPVSLVLCLSPALMLSSVDWLRSLCFWLLRARGRVLEALPWHYAFLVGALAKLATLSAVYPLLRGKTLLQLEDDPRAGIFRVLRHLLRREGPQSLYRGLGAQMTKSLAAASVKYAIREEVEKRWQQFCQRKA